jgi:hypothetical protein
MCLPYRQTDVLQLLTYLVHISYCINSDRVIGIQQFTNSMFYYDDKVVRLHIK